MSFGNAQTNDMATPTGPTKTAGRPKKPAAAIRVATYVDVARDLAKLENRQATQRTELAATDALIAEKQKEMKTLTNGIGRKK